jgi:hypothetical protein
VLRKFVFAKAEDLPTVSGEPSTSYIQVNTSILFVTWIMPGQLGHFTLSGDAPIEILVFRGLQATSYQVLAPNRWLGLRLFRTSNYAMSDLLVLLGHCQNYWLTVP